MIKVRRRILEFAWLQSSPMARLDILNALCPKRFLNHGTDWRFGPLGQEILFLRERGARNRRFYT